MANSANIVERGADGIAVERPIPASQPGDVFPAGTVVDYAGSAAPTGWLICDGSVVSRATYPQLFTNIGTTYGAGDGVSTFGIPDYRGKTLVGKHSSGTFQTLGATGGEETHVLTTAELAAHAHSASSSIETAEHTHSGTTASSTLPVGQSTITTLDNIQFGSGSVFAGRVTGTDTGSHSHSFTTGPQLANHQHNITVNNAGSGSGHNNLQPYVVTNKIIRAY
jgi:microcystin-dependent protein